MSATGRELTRRTRRLRLSRFAARRQRQLYDVFVADGATTSSARPHPARPRIMQAPSARLSAVTRTRRQRATPLTMAMALSRILFWPTEHMVDARRARTAVLDVHADPRRPSSGKGERVELRDKVAVITAAAGGIGRACALGLAREGSVVVIADVDSARAAAVAEEIRLLGPPSQSICCDVTRDRDVQELAEQVVRRFGRVDLLHNHAGIGVSGPLDAIPLDEWELLYRFNVISQVRGVLAFLPHLRKTQGHIVNTSSSLALVGGHPLSARAIPYVASKSAIVGYSQCLAEWLRPQAVGVSLLVPEYTATNFDATMRRFGCGSPPGEAPTPAGSGARVQKPEDVAAAYVKGLREDRFLLSPSPDLERNLLRQAEGLLDPSCMHDVYLTH
jgi:NAD(P)-dependent dehydrogenase (short-subunit alcohol dehydrogenase family)